MTETTAHKAPITCGDMGCRRLATKVPADFILPASDEEDRRAKAAGAVRCTIHAGAAKRWKYRPISDWVDLSERTVLKGLAQERADEMAALRAERLAEKDAEQRKRNVAYHEAEWREFDGERAVVVTEASEDWRSDGGPGLAIKNEGTGQRWFDTVHVTTRTRDLDDDLPLPVEVHVSSSSFSVQQARALARALLELADRAEAMNKERHP